MAGVLTFVQQPRSTAPGLDLKPLKDSKQNQSEKRVSLKLLLQSMKCLSFWKELLGGIPRNPDGAAGSSALGAQSATQESSTSQTPERCRRAFLLFVWFRVFHATSVRLGPTNTI